LLITKEQLFSRTYARYPMQAASGSLLGPEWPGKPHFSTPSILSNPFGPCAEKPVALQLPQSIPDPVGSHFEDNQPSPHPARPDARQRYRDFARAFIASDVSGKPH